MRSATARNRRIATGWHLATVLVIGASLVAQLVLTIRGISVLVDDNGTSIAAMPTRLVRFFTYFTIQSNLLALTMATSLLLSPYRDGGLWRALRVASVVGMTVTFVVYLVALAPILDLSGIPWWTDVGFHIVAPTLTVVGWLLFGPWPRFDLATVAWFVLWPVCWLVYVLLLGAASGWYPYPFLDADARGYPHALLNCLLVAVLLLGVAGLCLAIDRRLSNTPAA